MAAPRRAAPKPHSWCGATSVKDETPPNRGPLWARRVGPRWGMKLPVASRKRACRLDWGEGGRLFGARARHGYWRADASGGLCSARDVSLAGLSLPVGSVVVVEPGALDGPGRARLGGPGDDQLGLAPGRDWRAALATAAHVRRRRRRRT